MTYITMRKSFTVLAVLSVITVLVLLSSVALAKKQNPLAATPNLSFPVVATDTIEVFYLTTWVDSDSDGVIDGSEWVLDYDLDDDGINEMTEPTPIEVVEVINEQYTGSYDGNADAIYYAYVLGDDGCAIDLDSDGVITDDDRTETAMTTWLQSMQPWYDQPVTTTETDPNLIWNADYVDAANSWQADWVVADQIVHIDFIDWGNPMENINPLVGQRFPVEVALYEKLEMPMTAFKMACLEYPGTKVELFGTSDSLSPDVGSFLYESHFATVLTNSFYAEVWNPDGSITSITLGPGIGPSGKMNFASGNGGWIPEMPGWHRVWLHTNDPLIDFTGAVVNNDEHYIMSSGCKVQDLNPNKLELVGIVGNSTYIDVLVERPKGRK